MAAETNFMNAWHKSPKAIPIEILYENAINEIVINAGAATETSLKSRSVILEIMRTPTYIKAGVVAVDGII